MATLKSTGAVRADEPPQKASRAQAAREKAAFKAFMRRTLGGFSPEEEKAPHARAFIVLSKREAREAAWVAMKLARFGMLRGVFTSVPEALAWERRQHVVMEDMSRRAAVAEAARAARAAKAAKVVLRNLMQDIQENAAGGLQ